MFAGLCSSPLPAFDLPYSLFFLLLRLLLANSLCFSSSENIWFHPHPMRIVLLVDRILVSPSTLIFISSFICFHCLLVFILVLELLEASVLPLWRQCNHTTWAAWKISFVFYCLQFKKMCVCVWIFPFFFLIWFSLGSIRYLKFHKR